MTHTDEDHDPVQQKIDDMADDRGRVLQTTIDYHATGEKYLYPRRGTASAPVHIIITTDVEKDVERSRAILAESLDYQIRQGVTPPRVRGVVLGGEREFALLRIAQNDAIAIHKALLDALPVATYALLRDQFVTIGGRAPRAVTENAQKEN